MKGTVLTLFCAITFAQGREFLIGNRQLCTCNPSDSHAICANWDREDIVIAHERCDKFYKCAYGKPVPYCCPKGTVFNIEKEDCDWPGEVKCGDRVLVSNDENECLQNNDNGNNDDNGEIGPCNCNPSEAPTICRAPDSEGVQIAHEYCNHFYICNHGTPVSMRCGPHTLYDPYTQKCEWEQNVVCGDRVIPKDDGNGNDNDNGGDGSESSDENKGTCNCDPAEAPQKCAAQDSDGILIAHENCDKYYICNHGKPLEMSCPPNTLYNPYKEQCDWARNVDCGDRIDPNCVCESGGVSGECNGNNEENNNNSGAGDNESGGDSGSGDGDSGGNDTGSDTGSNESGSADNTGSGDGSICNCNPNEAPNICAHDESDGILVAHENCDQFYICKYGKPVAQTCFNNFLYNPYTQLCEKPQNVNCQDRVVPGNNNNGGDGCSGGGDNTGGNGCSGDGGDGDSESGDDGSTCNCNPAEAPKICAQEESDGVLVAHENCNKFYKCAYGKPVARICPDGLLYNPHTKECDWPQNVDCGDRVIPEDNNGPDDGCNDGGSEDGGSEDGDDGSTCNCNPAEAPKICAQEGSDGVLVAHEKCNKFYKCAYGKPVAQICPDGLLYNPHTKECDWAQNVDCGDRVIPDNNDGGDDGSSGEDNDSGTGEDGGSEDGDDGSTCNCNPAEAPKICAQEGSDGVLVAHEKCNKFYKCAYGKPVARICPDGLLYNPHTKECDWAQNVDCGDRIIPEDNNGADDGSSDGGSEDGGSEDGDDESTCNCNPAEAPKICAQEGSDGVLVAHEKCNKFYKCAYGKPVAQICPDGLLYNPHTKECDWAQNVDCGDRVIPDNNDGGDDGCSGEDNDSGTGEDGGSEDGDDGSTCNCNPAEAPKICAQEGSDGVLVAHEKCNKFYKCAYGKPVARICPEGLLYNPHTKECDWAQNVDCGDRVIPDNNDGGDDGSSDGGSEDGGSEDGDNGSICNCNPAEAPKICAQEGSDGVLVAHEKCNKFYKCAYGNPVPRICPEGLLYNPHTKSCDWAQNVDCGDRVIPEDKEDDNNGNDDGDNDNNNCNDNPILAPEICAAPESNGVLVAHEDCSKFYMCSGGRPVTLSCPPNAPLFNPSIRACDAALNVQCGDRVIPDKIVDGDCQCLFGATTLCATPGMHGSRVPHDTCNQFYTCVHGRALLQSCSQGLFFDTKKQECQWPLFVNCDGRITPSSFSSLNKHSKARRPIVG